MKKICLLGSAILLCFSMNSIASLNPVKGQKPVKAKVARPASVSGFINNTSSSATALVTLTNTATGKSFAFDVSPGTNLSNLTIDDGTYTINVDSQSGTLHIFRCVNLQYGWNNWAPTPYTYSDYNTTRDGNMVIVVY
ncbi:hypothetical protein [Chitinophaga sp. 212800010-3]|uniref:hypothetical protein n=1 Tax=unclassified Chitinophaga TaxID=2619133 RepID=UPI002DE309DD|nr:hypothetical protein [Chitinophaga sp. 212800010-3]